MKTLRTIKIKFDLNGRLVEYDVAPNWTLLDFLRNELGITSPKKGCDLGECGACTVLLDNEPVYSCLILAPQVNGKTILTLEGLSKNGELHPIQSAFLEKNAFQCGYCTPGFILATKALLDKNKNPTVSEISKTLAGHLCRCTGYTRMFDAVLYAAEKLRKEK
jgi:carbon-monoxide dehydrogenase small subunit